METNVGPAVDQALWSANGAPANPHEDAAHVRGGIPGFVPGPANEARGALFQGMFDGPANDNREARLQAMMGNGLPALPQMPFVPPIPQAQPQPPQMPQMPPLPALPANAQGAPARPQLPLPAGPVNRQNAVPARPQQPLPGAPPRPRQALPPVRDLVSDKMGQTLGDDDVKSRHGLKGGTLNKGMAAVKYNTPIGESGEKQGFFKGNAEVPEALIRTMGNDFDATDPRMAARGVMSSRLDKALGTGALADEVFAQHGDVAGSTSAKAKGQELTTNKFGDMPADDRWRDFKNFGARYREHPTKPDRVQEVTHGEMNYTDFQNPETQRSAANLQLVDYLSGQVDRHTGNVFVDPKTGKATGIDNDASFGTRWHDKDATGENTFGQEISCLPKQVDAQTGQRILGMKEEELMKLLGGKDGDLQKLNEDEKAAALERFKNLKEHVGTLQHDDLLVKQWNNDTFTQARANGPNQSYTARWAEQAADAASGANAKNRLAPGVKPPQG